MSSGAGEIPDGAVTCGLTADGRVLYQARASTIPSGYDPTKDCLDIHYSDSRQPCHKTWKILTLKHCKLGVSLKLRPRQNGRHFADDIYKGIFLNENLWISIKISLKFVPKGSINNIPTLVQIMAWRRSGDKPLSEPMIVSLLTQICINLSPLGQNGRHFANDIFKCIFINGSVVFRFKFHWSLFLKVQLIISQHWFG